MFILSNATAMGFDTNTELTLIRIYILLEYMQNMINTSNQHNTYLYLSKKCLKIIIFTFIRIDAFF